MSKSKFKVGDVVYISRINGGLPIMDEGTIVEVFKSKDGDFYYDTNLKYFINESSIFKSKQQAFEALKRDVKSIITAMKNEMKRIEEKL